MTPVYTAPAQARLDGLDALRGLAMVWMTLFHFCFDLNYLGYWRQDFYNDPFWTWQRALIVSLFLFCAGMGQAMALARGQGWARFWRRWAQIAGCALLVSLGSWWLFPQSFIYFGVLHGLALMLIIARLTAGWGRRLWFAGLAALVLGLLAPHLLARAELAALAEALNRPALNWLGLITRKPVTEDYVPVLPWLGLIWWGMAAGTLWTRSSRVSRTWPLPPGARALARLGRWSLSYYMLHQPVMLAGLMALGWLLG